MTVSEEMLMAYADGELEGAARDAVAQAIAADPQLAQRVAAHQALRRRLRAGFDPVLAEPVPARLLAPVHKSSPARVSNVLPFPGRTPAPRRWAQWGSLAASFVLGAVVWQFAVQPTAAPISDRHGQLVASGYLAKALSGQLAAQQDASMRVQMGLSFRSRGGAYCRTFALQRGADAGLACHEEAGWVVQVLAHGEAPGPSSGNYRQAASAVPPVILRAVDAAIAGEALDAGGETAARAAGWQPKP